MPRLADVQALFHDLVTAPENVARTLAARGPAATTAVAAVIDGSARLSSVARLDLYAEMYFARIHDVLRDLYPRVHAAVGEGAFHNLVTDYLVACPPAHWSLGRVGARLPSFLATHALAARGPWLADVATLEAAELEVFDGPDGTALTMERLRAIPPERFFEVPLALIPAHVVIESRWGIDAETPDLPPRAEETTILVWRRDLVVQRRAVRGEERVALAHVARGLLLGELCAALLARHDETSAPTLALDLIVRWIGEGILADRV